MYKAQNAPIFECIFCYNDIMNTLDKAKQLSSHNPYLKKIIDEHKTKKTNTYIRKQQKYKEEVERLKEVFKDDTHPTLILTDEKGRTLKLPPSKHNLKQTDYKERLKELKTMARKPNKPSIKYYEQTIPNFPTLEETANTTENTSKTSNYKTHKKTTSQNFPYQTNNKEDTYVEDSTSTTTTLSPTSISSISTSISNEEETQLPHDPLLPIISSIGAKRARVWTDESIAFDNEAVIISTDTNSSSSSSSIEPNSLLKQDKKLSRTSHMRTQKVSHVKSSTHPTEGDGKTLQRSLPVIYSQKKSFSKSTMNLVNIYSAELTPVEIDLILEYKDELHLTHAELTALTLLKNMENDPKSADRYWKIQETMEKSKKTLTSVSTNNSSLLEEKLAQAEEAIFVKKPIDS